MYLQWIYIFILFWLKKKKRWKIRHISRNLNFCLKKKKHSCFRELHKVDFLFLTVNCRRKKQLLINSKPSKIPRESPSSQNSSPDAALLSSSATISPMGWLRLREHTTFIAQTYNFFTRNWRADRKRILWSSDGILVCE